MELYHVSFDQVKEFVPRIPSIYARTKGEDDTIPRICCAESLANCLKGMPLAGDVAWRMQQLGLPVVIHAYSLEASEESIMHNHEVQKYVPDAWFTGEEWILNKPKEVIRTDYELRNIHFEESRTYTGDALSIADCSFNKISDTDNVEILMDNLGVEKEKRNKIRSIMMEKSYTTLMMGMFIDFAEIICVGRGREELQLLQFSDKNHLRDIEKAAIGSFVPEKI